MDLRCRSSGMAIEVARPLGMLCMRTCHPVGTKCNQRSAEANNPITVGQATAV